MKIAFFYGTPQVVVYQSHSIDFDRLLLRDIHAEHLGMVKMKQLTPKYLWWPGPDKEIEETVKLCAACQESV